MSKGTSGTVHSLSPDEQETLTEILALLVHSLQVTPSSQPQKKTKTTDSDFGSTFPQAETP